MHKRMFAGFSTLAITATLLAPSFAMASENETKKPKLSETVAIDSKGDNNGLSKFKKHSENRHLKQVVGKVTAIVAPVADPKTDGSITIKKENGKSYTFSFDSTSSTKYTTFLRKYKGTATWNEIMVGDAVHVFATKLVGGKAIIVWNKGIWYAEVKGVVSNLNSTTMAMTLTVTKNGVEYTTTVKYDAFTTFLMKDGTAKTAADLANGQSIKIKGTWDVAGKFLLAKRIVIYPAES